MNKTLKITELEKYMSLISYISTFMGLAAACLAMAFCSLLLFLHAYLGRYYRSYYADKALPIALLATGLIFLVLCFLAVSRFRKHFHNPIKAYPKAADYFTQCSLTSHAKNVFSMVLFAAGSILAFIAPLLAEHYPLDIMLAAETATAGTGAFLMVSYRVKRKIFSRITLIPVKDETGEEDYDYGSGRKRAIIKWVLYWIAVLGIYLSISILFQGFVLYAFILVFAAIYFTLRILISNPFRRFSDIRSKRIGVRILNIFPVTATILLYFFVISNGSDYNRAYIAGLDYEGIVHNSSVSYDSESGVYTVSSVNEEFRILQLTDIHLCGSITTIGTDRKALDACYNLILETQPDLIILTGDMVYPIPIQTLSSDNYLTLFQLCDFMNNIGIPWAMVYGNHDTEAVAAYDARELSGVFLYFKEWWDSPMLYAAKQPDIYGRYNQYLRIENSDGSLNHILFLIDSNDYIKDVRKTNEYDSVHPDQMEWYARTIDQVSEEEGRLIPSFVFMHIPFPAFAEAQEALENGSGEAVYLFGENGESVSCPNQDSGFFDLILKKGSTEAVFVGHDHLNNMGIKYKGVDLVYSKSIDYFAYPGIAQKTEQRGGTLIVLSPNGSYRIEQVHYTK